MARSVVPWFASKSDKKAREDKSGQTIEPIPWHVFEYAIKARLPLAVKLVRTGDLVYAIAPTGRRRLVAVSAGVVWPPNSGTEFHIGSGEFRKAAPPLVPGPVTGPYLRDVYPEAVETAARLNAEARDNPRRVFGRLAG